VAWLLALLSFFLFFCHDSFENKPKTAQNKPLFRTAKLNPDTACFFARKHTHTQTHTSIAAKELLRKLYGKAANACKRKLKSNPVSETAFRRRANGAVFSRTYIFYTGSVNLSSDLRGFPGVLPAKLLGKFAKSVI